MKILAWKKYQNREVKTRSVWFRIQNDFIENPNFSEFNSDERVVWLHALCCASKLNTDTLRVPDQCSHRVLDRCTGIDEKSFHRTFEKLKKLRIVEIRTTRGSYADDTSVNADDTLQDETEQDETRRDKTERNKYFISVGSEEPPRALECFKSLESVFIERGVSEEIQRRWIDAFPDSEWIVEQIRAALAWEAAVKNRRKKNFSKFITGWLTRGWDQRRIPGPQVFQNNPAYRRQAGNQYALEQALASIGESDDEAS